MKCKYCGAELNDDVKFCTECGQKVMRDRTFLDPLPELDEYRRVRNRLRFFDEHSKPLNIYCYVMLGILAVMFIAGFVLKLEFLPIFAGIFILITLLMLWSNNRESKRVRFAIGRPLVVIMPLLVIQIIFASVFMYSNRDSYDKSFGLKDYEGFYCRTDTEEIEDYEVTYTHGYQFNGDGTGVAYEQDVVDFTWNETELHFADNVESFVMEPGKLSIGGIVYDKIEGKLITPNPCYVDIDNIENGIFNAYIDEYEVDEADKNLSIRTEIYTEDSYDIVDVNRMSKGDVIYINGKLLPVYSISHTDSGLLEINGGVENNGSALIAVDESNCFVYAGVDMERSYTFQGTTSLVVSDDVKFIDKQDPSEDKEYTGSDAVLALTELIKEHPFTCYNCSIMVENGEIIEIDRLYMP